MSKPPSKGIKTEKGTPETPDADAALWQRVTQGVKPIKSNRFTENPVTPAAQVEQKEAPAKQTRTYDHKTHPTQEAANRPAQARELDHGTAPGVDKRTHQRLIKGKMPIEGRLDLHGHTKETGHRALNAFITGAFTAGKRCVIVITGKGLRLNSGEVGVLRQAVPQWLNSPTLRPMVLAFSHATPKDGGEGAVYVLLKRSR